MADEENTRLVPWGLHPLEPWIVEELKKRSFEYGIEPNPIGNNPYSGPKTAWARLFSNGKSSIASGLEGFVMGGTEGFEESYGFADGKVTIGVDARGKKHELDASFDIAQRGSPDFPHRPPPSLISVESDFSGGSNSSFSALCRKTKIKWKCHSLAQLEYLTPYFLTPRITCLVEWGWNYYDNSVLVDLTNIEELYGIFEGKRELTTDRIKRAKGNYDLAMGFIIDYGYTLNEYGGYDCSTTITNANTLVEGKSYHTKKDYKQDPNDKAGTLKLKDFTEFVFDDIGNLGISTSTPDKKTKKVVKLKNVNTNGKIFKTKDDAWIRMDLISEIINNFFQISFLSPQNTNTRINAAKFDIKDVPICAHPALKSTDPKFIIPNKFAPRFTAKEKNAKADKKTLGNAQTPKGAYYSLFPNIQKIMTDNKLDEKYDDIVEALRTKGAYARSFPMYSDYTGQKANNSPRAGYWGYLADIYVSVDLFKDLVKKNDTVLKLIEELLGSLSEAMCNIVQLKCIPDTIGNSVYSVMDTNFTPVGTNKDAESLMVISLGSINSAFIRNASLDVKLPGEMMNQVVMQSSTGKLLPQGYGASNYDPKTLRTSKFSVGDRMFERGAIPPEQVEDSNDSGESEESKYSRMFTEENSDFYIYQPDKPVDGKREKYVIAEKSPDFLKTILLDTKDKKAVYNNAGILPGTEFKMELLGIAGIRFLGQFLLEHVPSSYSYEQCVWQVANVTQKIENKVWTTIVLAQARPLTTFDNETDGTEE